MATSLMSTITAPITTATSPYCRARPKDCPKQARPN